MGLSWGHVGVNVTDLERSVEFYTAVFGFDVMGQSDAPGRAFAFLGKGKQLMVTLWEQGREPFDAGRAGLHHLAFQLDSRDALDAVLSKLAALDAKTYHDGVVAHREGAGSGGVYFEDPDGTRLELYLPSGLEGAPAPSGRAPTCGFF